MPATAQWSARTSQNRLHLRAAGIESARATLRRGLLLLPRSGLSRLPSLRLLVWSRLSGLRVPRGGSCGLRSYFPWLWRWLWRWLRLHGELHRTLRTSFSCRCQDTSTAASAASAASATAGDGRRRTAADMILDPAHEPDEAASLGKNELGAAVWHRDFEVQVSRQVVDHAQVVSRAVSGLYDVPPPVRADQRDAIGHPPRRRAASPAPPHLSGLSITLELGDVANSGQSVFRRACCPSCLVP